MKFLSTFYKWFHLLFKDHGIVRMLYPNLHHVGGALYRSSHPLPSNFRVLNRLGIRSIINLRGGSETNFFYIIEKQQCEKHNITLIDFNSSSSSLMYKEQLNQALDLLETIQYPALIHCKSGADRAGFMATLYNIHIRKIPYPQAHALKWYYGHLIFWSTGILDEFFKHWQQFHADNPNVTLRQWINNYYDPESITQSFKVNRYGEWIARKLLKRE